MTVGHSASDIGKGVDESRNCRGSIFLDLRACMHRMLSVVALIPRIKLGIRCQNAPYGRQNNVPMLNADPDLVLNQDQRGSGNTLRIADGSRMFLRT